MKYKENADFIQQVTTVKFDDTYFKYIKND